MLARIIRSVLVILCFVFLIFLILFLYGEFIIFLKAATVFVTFLPKHRNGESFCGVKDEHHLCLFPKSSFSYLGSLAFH